MIELLASLGSGAWAVIGAVGGALIKKLFDLLITFLKKRTEAQETLRKDIYQMYRDLKSDYRYVQKDRDEWRKRCDEWRHRYYDCKEDALDEEDTG